MAPLYGPLINTKGMIFIQPLHTHEVTSPVPYSGATRAGWLTVKARRNRTPSPRRGR